MSRFLLLLAIALIAAAGCAPFLSKRVPENTTPLKPEAREGIVYFLPKGKIHIVAVRKESYVTNAPLSRTKISETVTNVSSRLSVTTNVAGAATRIVTRTNSLSSIGTSTNGNGPVILTSVQSTNDVTSDPPANHVETEVLTSLEGTNRVEITSDEPDIKPVFSYEITITEEYERDPSQMYLLDRKSSWTSADSMRVIVGTNGLLTSIASTNSDKTGEIIAELAQAAAEAFKLTVSGGAPFVSPAAAPPRLVDIVFDPFDDASRARAITAFHETGLTLNLDSFVNDQDKFAGWATPEAPAKGVFYKPLLPYEVRIESQPDYRIKTVNLPNRAPVLAYTAKRAAFVTTTTQLGFWNGCLVDVYSDKPSEALAIAKVPRQVIGSLVSIPTNLLQLKFDIKSATQKLDNLTTNPLLARASEIDNHIKLIEAEKRLNATRESLTNSATQAELQAIEEQIKVMEAQKRLAEAEKRLLDAQKALTNNAAQ